MTAAEDAVLNDKGEMAFDVEPLIPEEASKHRPLLNDLALELATCSAELSASLPPAIRAPLSDLVRSMNCYYSNLIEGHDTHPIDVERALRKDFSADPKQRDLQIEAVSHIEVQKWIDGGGLELHPLDPEALCEIHRRFCDGLPDNLLVQTDAEGNEVRTVPGEFRKDFVGVGKHVPPSPGAVRRLLNHMHRMYAMQGRLGSVLAVGCAHHRLVWVHPFSDMNGRVSRMVAHAMLRDLVGSEGLWSASRGLARNVEDYRARLAAADDQRAGGADGRGALSEARLAEFAEFFLRCCIDQVSFMKDLVRPAELRGRVMAWAASEEMRGGVLKGSDRVLRAILMEGELDRGAIPGMLGVSDRQARKVTSRLIEREALASDGPRAPLRLHFPATLASAWMPNLFPDK
ncbi:Fic family protein [Sulfitobacter sp. 1A13353]|uniref:Fic family protein n=1 Tax=Sulfitobacter sp. 1A13353 TaxID=3368568 RepID=UPI0037450B21